MTTMDLRLDCSACKTPSAMTATQVAKFSGVVRAIGGILLIPSILGIGFALLVFISTVMASSGVMSNANSEAEQTGAAIGFGIGFVFSLFVGIVSFVGGL